MTELPRKWLYNRMYAMSEVVSLFCQGLQNLLNAALRFPFAIVFGWPDMQQQAQDRMRMLATQMTELEDAATAKVGKPGGPE